MGVRGELFSTKVSLQNRTYFFNVKENRLGDLYLNMVESKNRDEGGFERQSIILFAEDLQEFLQGFDESLRVLEKSAREKRRGPSHRDGPPRRSDDRPRPPRRHDSEGRGERRFDEQPFHSRPPRRPDSDERGERRFRERPRFDEERGEGGGFPRGRGGRGDREGRGERPPRPRFGDKQGRRGEGRPRREERKDRGDKPPFTPGKRVVVKKR